MSGRAQRAGSQQKPGSSQPPATVMTNRRFKATAIILALIGLGLGVRLAFWQIADHARLSAMASSSGSAALISQPSRGTITDDDGNPLAVSDEVYSVYAAPDQITVPAPEARILSALLHLNRAKLMHILSGNAPSVLLATKVSQGTADAIQGRPGLAGIWLEANPNRVYPEGTLASQLLGFESPNGGQYGLEQEYNPLLSGSATQAQLIHLAHSTNLVLPGSPQTSGPLSGCRSTAMFRTWLNKRCAARSSAWARQAGRQSSATRKPDGS